MSKPKTIIQKIRDVRREIIKDKTGTKADDLMELAAKALLAGIYKPDGKPTKDWETLMKNFAYAGDSDQLERLCGQVDAFMVPFPNGWGPLCLVYIAGNAACGILTATDTGTERGFTKGMYDFMDRFEDEDTDDLYKPFKCSDVERKEQADLFEAYRLKMRKK